MAAVDDEGRCFRNDTPESSSVGPTPEMRAMESLEIFGQVSVYPRDE